MEDSLFDVCVRMRPFVPAKIVQTSFNSKLSLNSQTPYQDSTTNKSRSASPISQVRAKDYEAVTIEGSSICFRESSIDSSLGDVSPNSFSKSRRRLPREAILFPSLFNRFTTNLDIFNSTVKPRLDITPGQSMTFLTYGISGSGKTHTIFGTNSKQKTQKERGVIGYTVGHIFEATERLSKSQIELGDLDNDPRVSVSFLEIYNEHVYNLLASKRTEKLSIIESPFANGVLVPGLLNYKVDSSEELDELLQEAQSKRAVAKNRNNRFSSRSHVIIEIKVSFKGEKEGKRLCKIRFVDLAGSEKISLEKKTTVKEGANINKSLLALTNCINTLADRKRTTRSFIPYRNSKLTRLLKEPLGGDKPIVMVVCLSPNSVYLEETVNSIKYAQKAQKISAQRPNKIDSKINLSAKEFYRKRISELEQECRYLKTVVKARELTSAHKISSQNERSQNSELKSSPLLKEDQHLFKKQQQILMNLVDELTEQIEESHSIHQTIIELDFLIVEIDERVSELQIDFESDQEFEQQTSCDEMRSLAEQLENNLDLKEVALEESEILDKAIKETKQRISQAYLSGSLVTGNFQKGILPQISTDDIITEGRKYSGTMTSSFNASISIPNRETASENQILASHSNQESEFSQPELKENVSSQYCLKEIRTGQIEKLKIGEGYSRFENTVQNLMMSLKPQIEQTPLRRPGITGKENKDATLKTLMYSESEFGFETLRMKLNEPSFREEINYKSHDKTQTNPMSLIST